jgi:hypothetical protein
MIKGGFRFTVVSYARILTGGFTGQINSIEFSIVWSVAPVLVSVISFGAFAYNGNHLTVAVAFTTMQIFSMIKTCVQLFCNAHFGF